MLFVVVAFVASFGLALLIGACLPPRENSSRAIARIEAERAAFRQIGFDNLHASALALNQDQDHA